MLSVAHRDRTVRHRRARGAGSAAAHVHKGRQRAARKLLARRILAVIAAADAEGSAAGAVGGVIINAVPAQRAGGQTVIRRIRGRGDDRAVKLRMVADKDVIAAVARKQPALVANAGVLAVYLAFAEA